jgi:hypothetical protein
MAKGYLILTKPMLWYSFSNYSLFVLPVSSHITDWAILPPDFSQIQTSLPLLLSIVERCYCNTFHLEITYIKYTIFNILFVNASISSREGCCLRTLFFLHMWYLQVSMATVNVSYILSVKTYATFMVNQL